MNYISLNILCTVFLLERFIFISVSAQEIIANNTTVVRGEIATVKWSLEKGETYNTIGVVAVYWGDRPNSSTFLFDSNENSGELKERFMQRLSRGTFIREINKPRKVGYGFNITNVRYVDKGMFNLHVPFGKGRTGPRVFRNATISLDVKGSFLIFNIFLALSINRKQCKSLEPLSTMHSASCY